MTSNHPEPKLHSWRKSSRSASGGSADCVEVASCTCRDIAIRDSKHLATPPLTVTQADWFALLSAVKPS